MSSSPNIAYALIVSMGSQGALSGSYVIFDPTGAAVRNAGFGFNLTYGITTDDLHEDIADAIRADAVDPDLKVRFVDYPGKF